MSRLEHLDGLRAVLALWVVGDHAWLTIFPTVGASSNPRGLLGLATTWMVYGHFAVVAFIVVSGYSLAISTTAHGARLRGGFWTFLKRRFTRIVLPYWGALAISLLLATTVIGRDTGTHWDAALPVTQVGVVLHALLLQDFSGTGQINHALWSIALEWHIYLAFPLVLLLRRRFGLLYVTAGVMAAGLLVSALNHGGLTLWAEANLLGCFALGVAAREMATRASRVPWDLVAGSLLGGFVVVAGILGTVRASGGSNTLLEPLFGLGVAALLVSLSQEHTAWLRRGLSWRPLAAVGTYSYSLYLLHAPVLQLVWQYVMRPLGLPLHDGWALGGLLLLGVPASLTVGWTYFALWERPCTTLGRGAPSVVPCKVLVGVEA